jgi:hypothetical protein
VITKQDITEIAAVLDEQAEARRYLRTRADSLCEDAFGPTAKESLTIPNCPPAVATRVPEESISPPVRVHGPATKDGINPPQVGTTARDFFTGGTGVENGKPAQDPMALFSGERPERTREAVASCPSELLHGAGESLFHDLPPSRPWSDDYLKLLASKPHWVQAEIMAFPTGVMARNLAVELAEREGKS